MTRAEAITELVRIWHSPHLDLILKARLTEVIEALKGEDGDLIRREDAREAIHKPDYSYEAGMVMRLKEALSAEEVVRCKNCRWYGHIGCAIEIKDDSDKPKPDDFCSFGEKRGDANE